MADRKKSLDQHWANYRRARATTGLSDHSWSRFQTEFVAIAKHLARIAEAVPTEEHLTRANLREAFAEYSTERVVHVAGGGMKKRSKSTTAGCVSTWNRFMTFLVVEEIVPGNPMAVVEVPKVPKSEPKALDGGQETLNALVDSLRRGDRANARYPWPERDLALIVMYGTTGLRQQELAQLNLRDLDVQQNGKSHARVVGKGGAERSQPVPDETILAVAHYMESRALRFPPKGNGFSPTDPVMVNDRGGRLSPANIRHIVRTCFEAAGISGKVKTGALVHALRHTYATDLAERKEPATVIQRLLGHASLATSQRYVNVSDDTIREAAQKSTIATLLRDAS